MYIFLVLILFSFFSYKRLEILTTICTEPDLMDFGNNSLDRDSVRMLYEMAPKLNDVFETCRFLDEAVDCYRIFKPTLTEDGVCYTFNSFDSKQMFNEEE